MLEHGAIWMGVESVGVVVRSLVLMFSARFSFNFQYRCGSA